MKSSQTCPKCASRKVVKIKPKNSTSQKLGFGNWGKYEKKDRYVCITCGYIEEYAVLSTKFLKWANKNLPKDWEVDEDYV